MAKELQLIPHNGMKYSGQTVMLSGHHFANCVFEGCTLLVNNIPFSTNNVEFRQCNVHIEYDMLWGAPDSVTSLRKTIDLFTGVLPGTKAIPAAAPAPATA